MAAACGTCHAALKQKIEWKPASEGPEASGSSAHMAKHLEAATLLWQGLAGPSDESWAAGLEVLSADPLVPEQLAVGFALEDSAAPLMDVHGGDTTPQASLRPDHSFSEWPGSVGHLGFSAGSSSPAPCRAYDDSDTRLHRAATARC